MIQDLKPGFIRFPGILGIQSLLPIYYTTWCSGRYIFVGGCFVEGEWLRNAFRWKETIGPWEERPGHFGDVWMYWTDDGLGHYEFLQVLFWCI